MKTHKHLWDEFISAENFEIAAAHALRGKKSKISAKNFMRRRPRKLARLRESLQNGTYTTGRHRIFTVYEPKKRNVFMLPLYPDHIVHHALMNILAPIWQKLFIKDSYACIPGRGLHTASHRCMQMLRRNKYVLQCDIRKFYPSINHEIMMKILRRKITDKRLLKILENIVRSVDTERGMPIGNLTSQWMGNLYLNDLDMFVKHNMRVRDYIRYCDDFCLFADDRETLRRYRDTLREYLGTELDLVFSKAFIKPTDAGINFIGYRHFKEYVGLTKAGAKKMKRKMRTLIKHTDISPHTRSQLAAFSGWMQWARCDNLRRKFRADARQTKDSAFIRFFNKYLT